MDTVKYLREPLQKDIQVLSNNTAYSNIADAKELSKVDENELISHQNQPYLTHNTQYLAENSEENDTARKDGYEPDTPKLGTKSLVSGQSKNSVNVAGTNTGAQISHSNKNERVLTQNSHNQHLGAELDSFEDAMRNVGYHEAKANTQNLKKPKQIMNQTTKFNKDDDDVVFEQRKQNRTIETDGGKLGDGRGSRKDLGDPVELTNQHASSFDNSI